MIMSNMESGLFPIICRANHACVPNCIYIWDEENQSQDCPNCSPSSVGPTMLVSLTVLQYPADYLLLKGQCHEIFSTLFLKKKTQPEPIWTGYNGFGKFFSFHENILEKRVSAQSLTSLTPFPRSRSRGLGGWIGDNSYEDYSHQKRILQMKHHYCFVKIYSLGNFLAFEHNLWSMP